MKKYLGLIGIGLFAMVSILTSVVNWQDPSLTISRHLASETWSIVLFAIFGTIGALLITYALLFEIPRKWQLGVVYKIMAGIISAGLVVVCLIPHAGALTIVHIISARVAFLTIAALYLDILIELWRILKMRVMFLTILLLNVPIGIIAVFAPNIFWNWVFVFESTFMAIFFVAVGVLSIRQQKI